MEQIEPPPHLKGHLGMKRVLLLFLVAAPLMAQQKDATTQNPLDTLHDQAKAVFEKAGFPFSEEQEKSVALMIEDRRQASEDLFGQLMDFRSGPVQGQQQDRAVAAITNQGQTKIFVFSQHATVLRAASFLALRFRSAKKMLV